MQTTAATHAHWGLALAIPMIFVIVFAVLPCALKSRLASEETGESDGATLFGMVGAVALALVGWWVWHRVGSHATACGVLPMGGLAARLMSGLITGRPINDHGWLTHEAVMDAISAPLGRERSTVLWCYADECDSVGASGLAVDLRCMAVEPCEMYVSSIGPDLGPIRSYAVSFVTGYGDPSTDPATWSDEDLSRAVYTITRDYRTGRGASLGTAYREHCEDFPTPSPSADVCGHGVALYGPAPTFDAVDCPECDHGNAISDLGRDA